MELSTAVLLIGDGVDDGPSQSWVDLGAGKGMFTNALSTVLKSGKIVAVDKDSGALKAIKISNPAVQLELMTGELLSVKYEVASLDGILMANAIHYVKDKVALFNKLIPALKKSGRIILVEYDMHASNPYVPYPVSFSTLEQIAEEVGFSSCVRLASAPSVYQRAGMYSALLR